MMLALEKKDVVVDFFADDIVLIAPPSKRKLCALLKKVLKWANRNVFKCLFGIEKYATMVIKPMNFHPPPKL